MVMICFRIPNGYDVILYAVWLSSVSLCVSLMMCLSMPYSYDVSVCPVVIMYFSVTRGCVFQCAQGL